MAEIYTIHQILSSISFRILTLKIALITIPLLYTPELTTEIEQFFDPEEYASLNQGESFNLMPGQYELIPTTTNPFRHEHSQCEVMWFVVAGVAERVGMPLAC